MNVISHYKDSPLNYYKYINEFPLVFIYALADNMISQCQQP